MKLIITYTNEDFWTFEADDDPSTYYKLVKKNELFYYCYYCANGSEVLVWEKHAFSSGEAIGYVVKVLSDAMRTK